MSDSKLQYGGAATHGAGFGNKHTNATAADPVDTSGTRFEPELQKNPSVGSAGHGNKTTDGFNKDGTFLPLEQRRASRSNKSTDSTIGKLMEKAGSVLHSNKLQESGRERRASAGYEGHQAPLAH
jgi:hypothetical protein